MLCELKHELFASNAYGANVHFSILLESLMFFGKLIFFWKVFKLQMKILSIEEINGLQMATRATSPQDITQYTKPL